MEDNLSLSNFNPTMGFQTRTTNRAYRAYELLDADSRSRQLQHHEPIPLRRHARGEVDAAGQWQLLTRALRQVGRSACLATVLTREGRGN